MTRKEAKALADLARRLHNPTGPEVPFQALQDMEEAARFIDSALAALPPAPKAPKAPKAPTPAPSAWADTAASVAADLARQAMRAALNGEAGQAARSYLTDSGSVFCRASFDGDSVLTAWDCDGRPLSRASAESLIAARMAARIGGL